MLQISLFMFRPDNDWTEDTYNGITYRVVYTPAVLKPYIKEDGYIKTYVYPLPRAERYLWRLILNATESNQLLSSDELTQLMMDRVNYVDSLRKLERDKLADIIIDIRLDNGIDGSTDW